MKDNFSNQAKLYSRFRPDYPVELLDFILKNTAGRSMAWDCGTGNGQLAKKLSPYFDQIVATDISLKQLEQAKKSPNIIYRLEQAESSSLENHQFDLVTVAQAIHWFDFEKFYSEVNRTLKPGSTIAVLGYALLRINAEIDSVIDHFYTQTVGPYWDKERRFIDEHYQTIPFPFEEISHPGFEHYCHWTYEQLMGYLHTWSSVQHYQKHKNRNPVDMVSPQLKEAWGEAGNQKIKFPILLRIGTT